METVELFKGIAIVIDNEVNNQKANIHYILDQINQKNIPFLAYQTLPTDEIIANFKDLSFLLLDWDLTTDSSTSDTIQEGVIFPDTLKKSGTDENINFIKKLTHICFCPIFIFSNVDINVIINKLEENRIYSKDKPNHIFVKSKSDLTEKMMLFKEIEKWVRCNPSIYVLKEWENEYQKSKNRMFVEFQKLSPVWPKIMWKTYGDDGANNSLELGELITRNLHTRMTPFEFSDEILSLKEEIIDRIELCRVLEGERFLLNTNLHNDNIAPGDVFKVSSCYYVNIRAACDLFPDRNKKDDNLDDVQLYLLKGFALSEKQVNHKFSEKYGHFDEHDNQVIIFPILDGKTIDFQFKNLEIMKWAELRDKRIGRVLPPYITRIQQKYAQYIQRQGLPRTPREAVVSLCDEPRTMPETTIP